MANRVRLYLLSFVLGLSYFSPASAITIEIVPSAQTVQVGDVFSLDVVVSGLAIANEIVSAYDLDIAYDATLLNATGIIFGPYLDDLFFPGISLQDADLATAGIVDFAEVSLLSDLELAAQQPDRFILATLSFEAFNAGSSQLSFLPDPIFGFDVKGGGALILPLDVIDGLITVTTPSVGIPEPSTVAMLLLALFTLGLTNRPQTICDRGRGISR